MNRYTFGFDIGGMSIKIGLFDGEELIEKFRIETTTENNGENILPDTIRELKRIMEEKNISKQEVEGIGMGVPGAIINQGIAMQAVNLGWKEVDVKSIMEESLGIKTLVTNDANAAALGEMWKGGIKKGDENVVFITLGTGVGGGIVIDGKILEGTAGAGGEIGHFPIIDEDLPWECGCGNRRCSEQLCSASGVVRIAENLIKETNKESKLREVGIFEAKDVIDLARENDPLAKETVEINAYYVGKLMATLAAIVNPAYFILGGGLAEAGSFLLDKYDEEYRSQTFSGAMNAKVLHAKLGNDAGIYGAAKLILG